MSATADRIAKLRRMIAEPSETNYSDEDLADYIELYPMIDYNGEMPFAFDYDTSPPTRSANADWIATYDLSAAAADIWGEKSATAAQNYDFSSDGANYSRSKVFDQYAARERFYRSRRSASTVKLLPKTEGIEEDGTIINH